MLISILKSQKYNVIKSNNQLHDGFNPIGTILYLSKVDFLLVICHLIDLTFLVNLHNQFFELTYIINLFKSIYIKLAILLACDMLFLQTYICKRMYSYLLSYTWFR